MGCAPKLTQFWVIVKLKLLVVGPAKGGKSLISNLVSGHSKDFKPEGEDYNPTNGVRILTFDHASKKHGKIAVELWDCSGDKKYEDCYSCMVHGAHGAVIVVSGESKYPEKEIAPWFVGMLTSSSVKMKESQVLAVVCHPSMSDASSRNKQPKSYSVASGKGSLKIAAVHSGITTDDPAIFADMSGALQEDWSNWFEALIPVVKAQLESDERKLVDL
jgi:intraflagellar transport protein 22